MSAADVPAAADVIVQVSDTHLSRTHAWFVLNWPVFVGEMERLRPDLIVNSGDISFNGPDNADDLDFGARCHDRLPAPWRAIAGNHDTGEAPSASRLAQPVNDARLAAWWQAVGPSWWAEDRDGRGRGLRLIGIDTALMGSDHAEEAAQDVFLDAALAGAGDRRILLFMHMPPFWTDPDDERVTTSCVMPSARRRLLDKVASAGVTAIAAGHVHQYRVMDWRGIPVVTAPGTAFVNLTPAPVAGRAHRVRTGYVVWRFDGETLSHELVEPSTFLTIDASLWTDATMTTTNMPARPLAAGADLGFVWPVGRT